MNIETKAVYGNAEEYLNFGWEHTEDVNVRSGRSSHIEHVLARDKEMPNHRLLVALEEKYFALKATKKHYEKMQAWTCIWTFVLLVLPFVFYLLYKTAQKTRIEEHNANVQQQMDDIVKEAKTLW